FAAGSYRLGRLQRRGNDFVALRPELPKNPPVKPAVIQSRMQQQQRVARLEQQPGSGRGSIAEPAQRGSAVPRSVTPSPENRVQRTAPHTPSRSEARSSTPSSGIERQTPAGQPRS